MTQINDKLEDVLNAKSIIDKRARELASESQEDPLIYRTLIKDYNWKKMSWMLDEIMY